MLQRVMEVTLSAIKWKTALIYLDDILIFSKAVEDHMELVGKVLLLLVGASVTRKPEKHDWLAENMNYCEHLNHPGHLEIYESITEVIQELQDRTTKTDVRSFPWLCNIFRRFVPNFSKIAVPLNKKPRKDQPKMFGFLNYVGKLALDELKWILTNQPVLTLSGPAR